MRNPRGVANAGANPKGTWRFGSVIWCPYTAPFIHPLVLWKSATALPGGTI